MAFSFGKRSILGLVAGALMTLGVAAPVFASTPVTSGSNTVSVTATNQASLVFTLYAGNTVTFPPLDPAASSCATSPDQIGFAFKSNRSFTGTVKAVASTAAGHSNIGVTQLHWSMGTADCSSTAFTGASAPDAWFSSRPATTGDGFSNTYALDVNFSNTPGTIDMTLTYTVTQ